VAAKRLGLLHELVPNAARIAVLVNPANASSAESTLRYIPEAARAIGLQSQVLNASSNDEIDAAFAVLVRERLDALFVAPDSFFNSRRVQFATLSARDRIPAAYSDREIVEAGGLISYGTDFTDMCRQVGVYVGRILKGEKASDLPVVQATKFELVINVRTAKALGLEVPPTLLARADEVIEGTAASSSRCWAARLLGRSRRARRSRAGPIVLASFSRSQEMRRRRSHSSTSYASTASLKARISRLFQAVSRPVTSRS